MDGQRLCRVVGGGVILLLLLSRAATAQFVSTASIEGTVSDPSGASLPGVSVTLKSASL